MFSFRAFTYILKSILSPFLISIFTFFTLIFTFQFLQSSELFFQNSSSSQDVFKILFLLGVSYLPIIVPFCLLFAVLFGHGKLSGNSEFAAFSALGFSKMKLSIPSIVFSLVCFLVSFVSIHTWGPNARFKARALENSLKKKIAVTAFQPGVFLTQINDQVIYAEDQSTNGTFKKVFIYNSSQGGEEIFSKSGAFTGKDENIFGFNLHSGSVYSKNLSNKSNVILSFEKYLVEILNFNSKSPSKQRDISYSTTRQLKKNVAKFTKEPVLIEIYKRNMFALSCLFFLLVSLLSSMRIHDRSSRGSGFFVALITSISFWILLFGAEFFATAYNKPLFMYLPLIPATLFTLLFYRWIKLRSLI